MEKVVVTGIGVVSPVGIGTETFWKSITEGKSGIGYIENFDTSESKTNVGAEVKDFNAEDFMDKKEAKRMDRYCQFAVAAATLAVEDSGLDTDSVDPYRVGVITGTGIGGMNTFETECRKHDTRGPTRTSALFIPMMIPNMAAGNIAMKYGFKGINFTAVTACASSAHSIGEAFRAIKHGYLDLCVAGGTEAVITSLTVSGFANMTALSNAKTPDEASLPFDKRRSGFVIGEGGAMLVLESEKSAKQRGAKIYGEIAGYGATADAYHITCPDPEGDGAARAMTDAMNEAGLLPSDIGYINAHGTATPVNDKYETIAIKKAMGDFADKVNISSTKSMTGHLLGGAGALESAVCLLALRDGIIPPTINLNEPDPECDLNYTPLVAVKREIDAAITNSLGFGGHNASLLFKKSV